MLSPTKPLVLRFVLTAAVTLPAAAYAADAPHADAAAKDACIKACNECLRACRECIVGCDCPGCEKTCLTCIETCRACVALMEYDSAMAEDDPLPKSRPTSCERILMSRQGLERVLG